jgi:hypothetical protein
MSAGSTGDEKHARAGHRRPRERREGGDRRDGGEGEGGSGQGRGWRHGGDVTTDYFGTGYGVTVTKSDGSTVEIHLNSSFEALHGPVGWGGAPPPASGSVN